MLTKKTKCIPNQITCNLKYTCNILGLKNLKTKVQVISRRVTSSSYEVVDAGTFWIFTDSPMKYSDTSSGLHQQKIYSRGPTANEYDILLYVNKANVYTEIKIEYYKQKSR